jgi:hypothetical protein
MPLGLKVSPALNEVKPGFHFTRARWNPGFIRFWWVRRIRAAVLVIPAGLKFYFGGAGG